MSLNVAYCPNDELHGKWRDFGRTCPRCFPSQTYNVNGPLGFTETFNADTVDILCRMGLIKFKKTEHFANGRMIHYYEHSTG